MKKDRRMILSVLWIVFGATLFVLSVLGAIDSYWSGMGGGLLGVGIAQTIRFVRYHKDPEYREAVDVQNKDERNHFLSGKAWAWAGNCFVILNGVAVIVLKLMGQETLSLWTACNVCLLVVLYWLCWLWLRRKY